MLTRNAKTSMNSTVRPPPLLLKESLKISFLIHISFSMAVIRLLDLLRETVRKY